MIEADNFVPLAVPEIHKTYEQSSQCSCKGKNISLQCLVSVTRMKTALFLLIIQPHDVMDQLHILWIRTSGATDHG